MSGPFITDTFAGDLAVRLRAIDVDSTVQRGLDAASGDARDDLEHKVTEVGYFDVADALRIDKTSKYERLVGIPSGHSAYHSAKEMEYGALDHHTAPHAVFSLYQDTFALNAGETIARVIEKLVAP